MLCTRKRERKRKTEAGPAQRTSRVYDVGKVGVRRASGRALRALTSIDKYYKETTKCTRRWRETTYLLSLRLQMLGLFSSIFLIVDGFH
ncbi:hypothetical protein KP509_06G027200 [Ceratopteris richardii]|uniref:Uncharacterized protein n=1 Tax=Ceratopteris richardii TaxID=49495 RepID=A0A8T2UL87_CERRI|nr:hypothetical protein KP509_06G027200 [Ceratopteris richardii]